MRFPSAKSLVLSLLAAGPLALAAPTQLQPATAHSVQPHHQDTNAGLNIHDDSVRRRSSDSIAALSQHLYGRAPPPGGRPTDPKNPNQPQDPNAPQDPNTPQEPNVPKPNEPQNPNQNRPNDQPGQPPASNPVDIPLEMYPIGSEQWEANKPRVIEKGQGFVSNLKNAIDNNEAGAGNRRKIMEIPGLGLTEDTEPLEDWEYDDEYAYLRNEPFNMAAADGWSRRTVYQNGEVALEAVFGGNDRFAAALTSEKAQGLTWTQTMFDSMMTMLGGTEGLQSLKWIERKNIKRHGIDDSSKIRLETPDAIDYAFRTLGGQDGQQLQVDFSSQDPNMVDVVNYMSAQTHVARVLQMLREYREEFGNKQIAKLHLFNKATEGVGEYGMIIELTE